MGPFVPSETSTSVPENVVKSLVSPGAVDSEDYGASNPQSIQECLGHQRLRSHTSAPRFFISALAEGEVRAIPGLVLRGGDRVVIGPVRKTPLGLAWRKT